ncbi:hypothetical protein ELUMI_v1c05160 [Williamsoniiplasma luminosum]|uniref:Uncharacterized protein n=1 Tax=Williamsoniiplasma luminosum TaxID=214888 RepID=A0A2K8NTS5_9MOLU|nr:relaxase MobL [Williamsoniiplasma luminosum]ATZ17240.1 hypothetical protein ELUMI_v1c05160 [Williamsoniiplasma luminosum]
MIKKTTPVLLEVKAVSNAIPKPSKKANWYKSGDYLDYIARHEATRGIEFSTEEIIQLQSKKANAWKKYNYSLKQKKTLLESLSENHDVYTSIKKAIWDESFKDYKQTLLDLTSTKELHTGVFDLKGEISRKEMYFKKKAFNKIVDDQLIWSGVISFSEDFMNEHQIFSGKEFHKIVSRNLKKLMIQNELNPKQMETAISFHKNTDNTHFHFAFFEKYPTKYNNETKQKEFRKTFMLNLNSMRELEINIESDIKSNMEVFDDLFQSRDELRAAYKTTHNNFQEVFEDLILTKKPLSSNLLKCYRSVKKIKSKNNNLTFGSKNLSKKDKNNLLNLTTIYLENNPALNDKYLEFLEINKNVAKKQFDLFFESYSDSDFVKSKYPNLDKIELYNLTNLNDEELQWDYKFDLSDPIEFLKFKNNEFINENIFHKNENGIYEGILVQIGNELLEDVEYMTLPTLRKNQPTSFKTDNTFNSTDNYSFVDWKKNKDEYSINKFIDEVQYLSTQKAREIQYLIDTKDKQLTKQIN